MPKLGSEKHSWVPHRHFHWVDDFSMANELKVALIQGHSWASIFFRNPFSIYVAAERLTVQVCQLLAVLVVNAFLLSEDGGFQPTSAEDVYTGLIVCIISLLMRFPIFHLVEKMFQKTGSRHPLLALSERSKDLKPSAFLLLHLAREEQAHMGPQCVRYFGYILLAGGVVGLSTMTLVYGLRFELTLELAALNYKRHWLFTSLLAALLDVVMVSPLK
jgi:hypothetical protein